MWTEEYKNILTKRFFEKTVRLSSGCLMYLSCTDRDGYSRIGVDGIINQAHRISYLLFKGPIPAELQLDHLCRNRACWNPDHLEAVTCAENVRRGISGEILSNALKAWHKSKTHCVHGHKFDDKNTGYRTQNGFKSRVCLICAKNRQHLRSKTFREQHKELALEYSKDKRFNTNK